MTNHELRIQRIEAALERLASIVGDLEAQVPEYSYDVIPQAHEVSKIIRGERDGDPFLFPRENEGSL